MSGTTENYGRDQQALIDEYYNQYVYPVVIEYDVHQELAAQVDTIDFQQVPGSSRISEMLADQEFQKNIVTPYKAVVAREDAYAQVKESLGNIRRLLKEELN